MRRIGISRTRIIVFILVTFFGGLSVVWFKPENKEKRKRIYFLLEGIFLGRGQKTSNRSLSSPTITVHIYGAVMRAGTYLLPVGSSLKDLLSLCGLKENADTEALNREKKLQNGETIVVPEEKSWIEKGVESLGLGQAPSPSYLVKPFEIHELEEELQEK